MSKQVHYELYVRRKAGAPWTLDFATEDRAHAVDAAEQAISARRAVAVRVTKETLDDGDNAFRTVTIFSRGQAGGKEKPKAEDKEPLCVAPADLYSAHARERIGRLLDDWLQRHQATPFELLHRADLVASLESSDLEIQHAIQKIAVPEANARGLKVHDLIRSFQSLVQRTIDRLMKDAKRGALPDLDREGFAAAAERLVDEPDRAYLLGAGVAASIAPAKTWSDKISRLLDLADFAPQEPQARAVAMAVIEQPMAEILGSRSGLYELLGGERQMGDLLAAMIRLAGADQVEALIRIEPSVAKIMPPLTGVAARLSNWLGGQHFGQVRKSIAQRVLKELTGPRRLKPDDADAEIEYLRALAMALTAAAGRLLEAQDVHSAFATRSKTLVADDFVNTLLGRDGSSKQEIETLIRLAENVTGGANKRAAARWLTAAAGSLRFEREMRDGPDTPAVKLSQLAGLQRAVGRLGLAREDYEPIQQRLGELGSQIETESRLVATLARAAAPPLQRLNLLIRLASGEAAPLGPAADRAKIEALRLVRNPEVRKTLAAAPDSIPAVREFIHNARPAA